jgi:uncharacterized phage-associated protein
LFDSRIEAWANGPVNPELFSKHKGDYYVDNTWIPEYSYNESVFSNDAKETMNGVLDAYGAKAGWWLRQLTHSESPWKDARRGVPDMEPCTNEITLESMQHYYGSL